MHPMFVQLYLEPDSGEDQQDERRRAARSRRLRSARTLTRVNVARNTGNRDSHAAARAH
jgi:uncharacterized membrane-anchored protein